MKTNRRGFFGLVAGAIAAVASGLRFNRPVPDAAVETCGASELQSMGVLSLPAGWEPYCGEPCDLPAIFGRIFNEKLIEGYSIYDPTEADTA